MTRNEAKRLVRGSGPIGEEYKPYDDALVDALTALGILKLDEPKSNFMRLDEAIASLGANVSATDVVKIVDAAGFKIVEK